MSLDVPTILSGAALAVSLYTCMTPPAPCRGDSGERTVLKNGCAPTSCCAPSAPLILSSIHRPPCCAAPPIPRSATPFYASGQIHGGILYASGQIGITGADPKTGKKIFAGDTVNTQAKQVFKNLEAVLEEAGTSWDKVLKCTGFRETKGNPHRSIISRVIPLTYRSCDRTVINMDDYTAFNEVYLEHLLRRPHLLTKARQFATLFGSIL